MLPLPLKTVGEIAGLSGSACIRCGSKARSLYCLYCANYHKQRRSRSRATIFNKFQPPRAAFSLAGNSRTRQQTIPPQARKWGVDYLPARVSRLGGGKIQPRNTRNTRKGLPALRAPQRNRESVSLAAPRRIKQRNCIMENDLRRSLPNSVAIFRWSRPPSTSTAWSSRIARRQRRASN